MIRTRFAPSPTGFLHIGGLRTALFAYLIAKAKGGKLILRIEDTDQKREVEGATEKLIDILSWAGIVFDEGPHVGGEYGPYIQSQRKEIYDRHIPGLLEGGHAYRCFCSAERLTQMRADQEAAKQPPRYDRLCRSLSREESNGRAAQGESFVIRQALPLEGKIIVPDALRGEVVFDAVLIDDQVLIKANGIPTYHYAVVIDDHEMGITHVVRGEEWLPSAPKHVLLYRTLGWELPVFVHLPLILNKGGGKLSKRQGDVSVESYRDSGYLPSALLNFCTLLGWHPQDERETFMIDEIMAEFDLKAIKNSGAVFDTDKLDYLNGYHIRRLPDDELLVRARPFLASVLEKASRAAVKSDDHLMRVVKLEQERLKKFSELPELTDFFFNDEMVYEPALLSWKGQGREAVAANLALIGGLLEPLSNVQWSADTIAKTIQDHLAAHDLKNGEYLWPLRVALTGRKASPGPFEVAEVLGRDETLRRISNGILKAQEK